MTDTLTLSQSDVAEVVDVLHESFFDYPVMRFVLGSERPEYDRHLRTLVNFFVMARVLRNETLFGIRADQSLEGVALVSRPGGPKPPPELYELRDEVWAELGGDAESRYSAFGAACAPFDLDSPHLHLNMIGVRRGAQGTGLSRTLIDAVHSLSLADPASVGVTLTTEDPRNVSLYEHFGYEVVGRATVDPMLTTWGFFRPDDA